MMARSGQALAEYVLLVALIAVVLLTALLLLGGSVAEPFADVACAMHECEGSAPGGGQPEAPPGQGGTPPGQGGTPPGKGGTPPGQGGR
jgi:Flp pilus assembly pilin Flp